MLIESSMVEQRYENASSFDIWNPKTLRIEVFLRT